jgi:hypothetical protein
MNENFVSYLIVGIIAFFILFFLLRSIILWYYKINNRLKEAERTNYLLEKLLEHYNVKFLKLKDEEKTIVVKHKDSNEPVRISLIEWENMKRVYGEDLYTIIEE